MNDQADQPTTPGNQAGIPGKTLQSKREAMGWSVEQVADQLKLAPRQVVALEAGDYASLPSPAVTRGFVRVYAKLLKIDAAPLVSMIELNMPPEAQAGAPVNTAAVRRDGRPAAFSETRFPINGRRNRLPLGWIAGVVIVVGAAVAAWQLDVIPGLHPDRVGEAEVLDNPAAGVATPGVAAPGSAATNGAQQGLINPSVPLISVPSAAGDNAAPANTAPAATPAAAPVTPPATAPATTTAPANTSAAPAPASTPNPTVAPSSATVTPAAAPAAAGANALVLTVREDSWIEVRPSAGGRPLISRLVKAGSVETIDVTQPVSLVVGAPSGVSATLRGAAVALPQTPGRTIARVALK